MTQRTLQCIIGFFLFGSFASFGQQASLLVLDGQNDEPIEFAHVVYFSPSGKELGITDVDGRLVMDIEQPVSFAVTYVGYKTVSGTIEPGADRALRLVRGDYRLDDVVVTAQYSAIRPEESIILIRVIGNEQIESKGALNLSQLLNDELNIRLQTDGILGTGLSVQGLSGQNVKILVDGVPIIGRLDGIIDLNQINLQDIERVEIVEGPVSVNYGSNALAGAVNLISKKPKNDKLSGGGGFFYESVGVYNTDAWLDIPIHGKQSLRLSGGTNFFDGWSPIENGQRDLQWNQKEQLFGRAAYSTKLGKIDLGYEIRGFNELIKDKGERRSAYSNYAFDNWFTTYRVDNQISVGVPLGSKWKMDFIAGYNWFRRDNVQYNRDLVNLTEEVNSDARPHDTTRNSLFISRGTLGSINQEKAVNFQLGYEVNYETGGGKRIKDDYQSIGDYALFGSLQWKVTKDIKLQPGMIQFFYLMDIKRHSGRWIDGPKTR
jgi:outer membrane receptor for ferrienterochelin and colicins